MTASIEAQIIGSLRKGIPPQRGVEKYSVGYEKLIGDIRKYCLSQIPDAGMIRFVSGSWGGGKTHFFRLIRDVTFQENCAVSNVELGKDEAALNKFEKVFSNIVKRISTPRSYQEYQSGNLVPFGAVIEESLVKLGGCSNVFGNITNEQFSRACGILMNDKGIDLDFKKMIQHYWRTFLPESMDRASAEETREEVLQWFSGEGTIGTYRKRFGVNKMISRENAKLMLQSLSEFIRLSGYVGLVILFDEAEQSYSIMRKSELKDAQNNLLSLINNIENIPGLFMIYATTPDFFTDSKHGIVIYGALAGRIGKPEDKPPRALDTIWNLDAMTMRLEDYQEAGKKIRSIYIAAYPEAGDKIADEKETARFIEGLYQKHPKLGVVRFWRVLVTALVKEYDNQMHGNEVAVEKVYRDIMDRLPEE